MAKKADGSTALAAVVGYLVMMSVFETMSPVVLAGEVNPDGEQLMIDYQVFGGILIGLVTAWLFDKYYRIQLPTYLAFFGGRRFVPIVSPWPPSSWPSDCPTSSPSSTVP